MVEPKAKHEVTFIPAHEVADEEAEEQSSVLHKREHWEEVLEGLANRETTALRIPRSSDLPRTQVVNAFIDAFQLLGGTPRFALWADENPTEFYKLYAKLMPKQVEQETNVDATMKIIHALPRGKLDV